MRKRIGETGLPWGMPEETWEKSWIEPSKLSLSILLTSQEEVQEIRLRGSPSCLRILRSLFLATWSNAPLTSKKPIVVFSLASFAFCMLSWRRRAASIADFCLLPPIWEWWRRGETSARAPSLLAIILSLTLPRQLSREITL